MERDLELRRLAEQQHGLISRHQARALGLDRWQLYRRASSSQWDAIGDAVLRLVGAPRTDGQRMLAAVWSAGGAAALSHHSAAAWWDVPGFQLDPVHTVRLRNATERGGDRRSHEPRLLPPHHVEARDAVPVTTPARTVFDLAAVCHPGRVERALDTFWARSLIDHASLRAIVDELGRRGRTGTRLMRELLSAREEGYVAPESLLEARFHRLIADACDEPFECQVELGDERGRIGRVDAFDRQRRLVVEVDSERFHSSPSDVRNDQIRDARLRAAGYEVLRVPEEELRDRPRAALQRIRTARATAEIHLAS